MKGSGMAKAASPFGKDSRVKTLKKHLSEAGALTAATAWKFVYEELLWIDGSTGLAHLYESDKAQPGRSLWYPRSITFTSELIAGFGLRDRQELKARIDRLFRACLEKLVESKQRAADGEEVIQAVVEASEESGLPAELVEKVEEAVPAESDAYVPDADLVTEFATLLIDLVRMEEWEAEVLARRLVARARYFFTVERKRQNVLGEGFEDLVHLLALEIARIPAVRMKVRQKADLLPGFKRQSSRERIESPDFAIIEDDRTVLLASVKWSLRQDRQKQLSDELDCFVELLSQEAFPEYVLITNEYDPGRLINTAGLARRDEKIDCIYHINLDLLQAALSDHPKVVDVRKLMDSKQLRSLEDMLDDWGLRFH